MFRRKHYNGGILDMNYKVNQLDVKMMIISAGNVAESLVNQCEYNKMASFLKYYIKRIRKHVPADLLLADKVVMINDVEYLHSDRLFNAFAWNFYLKEADYKARVVEYLSRQYATDVLFNTKRSKTKLLEAFKADIASKLDEQYKEFVETGTVVDMLPTAVKEEIGRRYEEARAKKLENLQNRNKGGRKSAFTDIDEATLIELFATKTDKEIEALDDIEAKLSTIRGMRRKLALKYVVTKDEKLEQIKQDLKECKGDKEKEDALKEERKEVRASNNVAYDKRSQALITETNEHLEQFITQALSRRNVL